MFGLWLITSGLAFVNGIPVESWDSVPSIEDIPSFYVNESNAREWLGMKCGATPVAQVCSSFSFRRFKHCDDFWLLKQALVHPRRTADPASAEWFIVPALLNQIDDQASYFNQRCCIGTLCGYDNLRKKVDEDLQNSEYFQRWSGADHIIVASHYATGKFIKDLKNVLQCNMLSFEDRVYAANDRIILPSNYVGGACLPWQEHKTHDVAFIGNLGVKKNGSFEDRRLVCASLENQTLVSVSRCGRGEQCPALSLARYGFHVGGDTPGSNRLMDTILSGTVPIFTDQKQYEILPPFVPWKQMSLFIRLEDTNHKRLLKEVQHAISSANYTQIFSLMEKWIPYLDWMGANGKAFDLYMSAFDRLRHYQSRSPPLLL